jgi:hypothetical protein
VPPGSGWGYSCFPQSGGAFAVATYAGKGVVVSLGGADPWSNEYLGDNDNSLVAADLLAPGKGYTVAWLLTPAVGGGTATIWSIVPNRVKAFLAALGVAVLVACAWRARRLGRPVPEGPIVALPASELVVATGRLLAKNRRYEETGALMRDALSAQLRSRLGQAPGTAPATVAQVVAMRAGLPPDEVMAALCGPAPSSEDELLELARSLQRIQEEVLSGAITAR